MLSYQVAEMSHYLMLRMPKPHLVPHQPRGDTSNLAKVWPETLPGSGAPEGGPSSFGKCLACSEGLGAAGYMARFGTDWDSGRE